MLCYACMACVPFPFNHSEIQCIRPEIKGCAYRLRAHYCSSARYWYRTCTRIIPICITSYRLPSDSVISPNLSQCKINDTLHVSQPNVCELNKNSRQIWSNERKKFTEMAALIHSSPAGMVDDDNDARPTHKHIRPKVNFHFTRRRHTHEPNFSASPTNAWPMTMCPLMHFDFK